VSVTRLVRLSGRLIGSLERQESGELPTVAAVLSEVAGSEISQRFLLLLERNPAARKGSVLELNAPRSDPCKSGDSSFMHCAAATTRTRRASPELIL
jgi:hypothetical protein